MESEGQRLSAPMVRFEGEGVSIPLSARRRYRRAGCAGQHTHQPA